MTKKTIEFITGQIALLLALKEERQTLDSEIDELGMQVVDIVGKERKIKKLLCDSFPRAHYSLAIDGTRYVINIGRNANFDSVSITELVFFEPGDGKHE